MANLGKIAQTRIVKNSARVALGVLGANGMLAAPDEIGVSPAHDGILILPDGLELGTDVAAAFGLDDGVLDIEVTPNRPDFLSVLGIAREVSAATGTPATPPSFEPPESEEPVEGTASLEVLDLERCPRYLARVIRDVQHVPSPIAVQAQLTAAGMRPISAAIDATNYAMLEIGQPLHPFDLQLLKGPGIVVRRAEEGETVVTLDDVERTLTSDDLLICDVERPVAIAGVMGGEVAEMSASTTEILLESATFQRESIQRTRRRIDLSTEASMRFERGVDPEAPPVGAGRAAALMAEWCGATVARGVLEVGGAPERRRIGVRASRASLLIGSPIARPEVEDVFDRLDMRHENLTDDEVRVEVPGYRVDIEREVDLIEEIGRVRGYELVGSRLPPVRQAGGLPSGYAFRRRVRASLERAGLREVRSVPFASDADLERFGDVAAVRVTNPLQPDDGWMRTRLLPGLLRAMARNLARQVRSVAIFEVDTVWRGSGEVPSERRSVGLALSGTAQVSWAEPERPFDVFDARGAVDRLLDDFGIEWSVGEPPEGPWHPGRSGTVLVRGETVGIFGELHPRVAAAYDVSGRVAVAELEFDALERLGGAYRQVRASRRSVAISPSWCRATCRPRPFGGSSGAPAAI
jgi:phenylalanyl-tRNA synthetase beta chain